MSVDTTRKTLLARVRDSSDGEAWEQFFSLYAPLLEGYARALGLAPADAEEVRDECLALVARRMPSFEYERARGTFKAWLFRIAQGKVVDQLRRPTASRASTEALRKVADPADGQGELDERWEALWRREHLRHALDEARRAESASSIRVFELLLLEGLSVAEVGARTGLPAQRIYKAKARMLARVRQSLRRLGVES